MVAVCAAAGPGDAVVLNAGERVPGDGEVQEAIKLTLEEAILTGESEPIAKTAQEGQNHVAMGTTVLTERGLMRVTATGSQTELGQIATSLRDEIEDETPLQVRLKGFSRTLTILVLAITGFVLVGVADAQPDPVSQGALPRGTYRDESGRRWMYVIFSLRGASAEVGRIVYATLVPSFAVLNVMEETLLGPLLRIGLGSLIVSFVLAVLIALTLALALWALARERRAPVPVAAHGESTPAV